MQAKFLENRLKVILNSRLFHEPLHITYHDYQSVSMTGWQTKHNLGILLSQLPVLYVYFNTLLCHNKGPCMLS